MKTQLYDVLIVNKDNNDDAKFLMRCTLDALRAYAECHPDAIKRVKREQETVNGMFSMMHSTGSRLVYAVMKAQSDLGCEIEVNADRPSIERTI